MCRGLEKIDIFKKCYDWDFVKSLKTNDTYPYFAPIEEKGGTEIVMNSKKMIMIGSNDYLGLSNDHRLIDAASFITYKLGTSSSGSRFLNGTLELHNELECRLAQFLKKEKAIVFSTGYQTNLGAISALIGRNDVAIVDKSAHASIIDGVRLGFGKMKRFRHNDINDLEEQLKSIPDNAGKLIIVDGVFSMEGDLAKLKEIVSLKHKYNARLLVDDAHGIGVLGNYGRGTCEHFNLETEIDIITGTFSKAFGSLGGFVAGDEDIIDYIKHQGRSMIFSASMPPSSIAAAIVALEIIQTEPERRIKLLNISERFNKGLTQLGFNTGDTVTPIVPILIGNTQTTFLFWKKLMDLGVYTNPIINPAVPQGSELIRTTFMSTHSYEHVDTVLSVFEEAGKTLGIIKVPVY